MYAAKRRKITKHNYLPKLERKENEEKGKEW